MKYIHIHSEDIFKYLSDTHNLNKNVHFLCVIPEGVKYIFSKQNLNSELQTTVSVLKGYECEISNLTVCPDCMSEEDYALIPDDYKGTIYNIYYIPHIHKVKIRYVEPNNTANYITWIDNNKIINIFTEIYNAEQITDMQLDQFSEIFVETDLKQQT